MVQRLPYDVLMFAHVRETYGSRPWAVWLTFVDRMARVRGQSWLLWKSLDAKDIANDHPNKKGDNVEPD